MADLGNLGIPQVASFKPDLDPTSVAQRWKRWSDRFDNLVVAMNITDNARKKALLLHLAGETVFDIFSGLVLPDIPAEADPAITNCYTVAKTALDNHFNPKKNVEFEKYTFRSTKQQSEENLDAYHARLRSLAKYCEFADVDSEIKSHIIQTCRSSRLRRRALTDNTLTLTALIDLGRSMETTDRQTKLIEKSTKHASAVDSTTIAHIKRKQQQQRGGASNNWKSKPTTQSMRRVITTCRNCAQPWPHPGGKTSCPAWGSRCRGCNRENHWIKCCRSKGQGHEASVTANTSSTTFIPARGQGRNRGRRLLSQVNRVDEQEQQSDSDWSDNDDNYVFSLKPVSGSRSQHPIAKVFIQGTRVSMIIDSGSSVNILDEKQWLMMKNRPTLKPSKTLLFAYGSKKPICIIGEFESIIESTKKIAVSTIYVAKGNASLLSYKTASELELLTININSVTVDEHVITVDQLVQSHPELFDGVGKLTNYQVKLHIDESVKPVAQPHRRIPFHVRKQVEREIKSELEQDLIEAVKGPTEWVSPLVIAPKPHNPNEIRHCLDARQINRAIKRTRYVTPTLDDLICDLNGATVFSKIDLRQGYKQIELDEASRPITCFSTHMGLYQYKRLVFGLNSSSEVFQQTISQVFSDIEGVRNISDDLIIYGRNQTEHNKSLRAVIQRLVECGLTINRDKIELNKTSIRYYGHVFSSAGVSVDESRIRSLENILHHPPANATEVRSLIGFLQYAGRNIHNLATIMEPLRRLTKTDVMFQWGTGEQRALEVILSRLRENVTTSYFDPNLRSVIICDASPVGVSGILSQWTDDGRLVPITFVSKALTSIQRRWSQIEREAYAIVFTVERLRIFLCGTTFSVITDHKPLETLLCKPNVKLSARLERMRLRLAGYSYTIRYEPGRWNAADWMSRHPDDAEALKDKQQPNDDDVYVNFVANNAVPKSMTLDEIREATNADRTLQQVIKHVELNDWHTSTNNSIQPYKCVKDELTISLDGIVLRGTRIVMPESLQQRTIQLAHEGHQGITKCKALLREKVWFPSMDRKAESAITQCVYCAANTPQYAREPLKMSELPKSKWTDLSADFYGPLPTGELLLVIIDDYSRFPTVEIVHSTSANTTIAAFDRVLSQYSIPDVVKTDNGPPFNSVQFAKYAEHMGFKHRKITPLWPSSNAECERFMRTLGKALRIAHQEGKNWKQEMHSFLRAYRTTPHSTTGVSPHELLFNSKPRTRIPEYNLERSTVDNNIVRKRDDEAKAKMKTYADNRNKAKESKLEIGDIVLVRQEKKNKMSSFFDPIPFRVVEVKGSMITAARRDKTITRNSSFFKQLKSAVTACSKTATLPITDEDEDDYALVAPPGELQRNDLDQTAILGNTAETEQSRYPSRNRNRPSRLNDYVCSLE